MDNKTNNSDYVDIEEWKEYLDVVVTGGADWAHVLFTTLMIMTFVAGVCGNLLTCVVISCDKSMHTATNYYLFNLAITDFIMAFGILLELDGYIRYPNDVSGLGDLKCKIHFFLVITLWNADILTVTALAIERFIVIFYPMKLKGKPALNRILKVICVIWFLAVLETVPETWTVHLISSPRFSICTFVPTPLMRLLTGMLSFVTFVIPLGIMIFAYTMVAVKVKRAQASYSKAKIFNYRKSSNKVNKLIIALTVSFMICWLPFFAIRIVFAVDFRRSWFVQNWDMLMMFTSLNSWFSIVLNPLLLSLMSTKFRRALKNLWKKKDKKHQRMRKGLTL